MSADPLAQQQQQSAASSAQAASQQQQQQQPPTQSWTLFVGQIPNEVNEETLKHLFSTYGLVSESKILMDKVNNKPKGCGFITMTDKHGAETAIATLHEKYTLPGAARPLIVRYSTKQLAADKSDPGPFKLYISNLSKLTTEEEIRNMFSQYGQLIDDVVILKDQVTGVSKGVAFVRYEKRAEANAAITALNEQIRDKDAAHLMQVKFAHTPSEKKQLAQKQMQAASVMGQPNTPMGSYYPAHFNPSYPQQGYNPYALPPHMAGYHQGYGGMHGGLGGVSSPPHQMDRHRRSNVAKGPDGANLFVYGIPEAYTDADLSNMFANFGNVINAKVYRDLSTGKSKGFGFVSYDSLQSAQQACSQMDGFLIAGKKMTVKPKTDHPPAMPGQGVPHPSMLHQQHPHLGPQQGHPSQGPPQQGNAGNMAFLQNQQRQQQQHQQQQNQYQPHAGHPQHAQQGQQQRGFQNAY